MQNISDKVTGDSLTASEYTSHKNAPLNLINDAGITPSIGDAYQLSKATSNYVASGDFYVDSGAADAYVLSAQSPMRAITTLKNGIGIIFKAGNTCTGASTVNVGGLGVKDIKKNGLADALDASDIEINKFYELRYDSSADDFELIQLGLIVEQGLPTSYLQGFNVSNDVADVEHDLVIDTGSCRDEADTIDIALSASLTKKIDVNWVAGDVAGGFPSGLTLSADTWYHVFTIKNPSTLVVDCGFDTSLTAINLLSDATGYTKYRRLGSVLTDGSSNIIAFLQDDDVVTYDNIINDVSTSTTLTTRATVAISTPLGIKTKARLAAGVGAVATGVSSIIIASPDQSDQVPDASLYTAKEGSGGSSFEYGSYHEVMTDTSSQITYRSSNASGTLTISTIGYIDTRGKN